MLIPFLLNVKKKINIPWYPKIGVLHFGIKAWVLKNFGIVGSELV